ncbi:secretin N-terminal domain-containing protein [Uliginosibacterium flavum]
MPARLHSRLPTLLTCLILAGCAVSAIDSSRQMLAAGQSDVALNTLSEEMRLHPDDQEVRVLYFRTRDQVIGQALTVAERARDAGRPGEAEAQARIVLKHDRENPRALSLLRDLDAAKRRAQRVLDAQKLLDAKRLPEAESIVRALLAETPNDASVRALLRKIDEQSAANSPQREDKALKGGFTKPITLEFRDTSLRNVFEAISRTAGINFVFDKDVKADAKVTVFVRNTSIDEVVRLVLTTNQLDRKLLNENSVIIYPASAAKQKEYQELATRTFYLTNTEAKQAQSLVKSVVKTRDTFIDESLNILVIKDTPDAIRMAERLIAQLDVPAPEVMLEVEVLEVQRSKLLNLGIKYPDQIGYGLLQPTTNSVITTTLGSTASTNLGGQLLAGNINLNQTGALVPFTANPGLLLNLKDQSGMSNTLANPRIRVRNKEKAKIHIGDKLPVFTTTSTANVGVSAAVNYLDVGLKLDVEPTIRLDDEVEIKVGLEVSSVTKEVAGPQSSLAYQIGTRNATTVLRLKDGETQVLAGLISDEERSSVAGLPGLSRIPGLGRLFSTHSDNGAKTEIVLLITPRVLRNITPEASSRAAIAAGTENSIGSAPLMISTPTPAGSLNLRGSGASSSPASPASIEPSATPAAEQGAAPLSATLTLTSPRSLKPAQEFSVSVSLSASSEVRNAEVDLIWDSALFEAATPGANNTLKLTASGNSASGQILLRARAGVNAEGLLTLSNPRVTLETGSVNQVNTPEPLAVKVAP